MLDVVDVLRHWNTDIDGPATPNRITEKSPYGKDRTRNLLAKLVHAQTVTRSPIVVKGNKTHEYSIAEDQ